MEHGSSIPIGKSPEKIRSQYCFHVPSISEVFLKDPVSFPPLFGGIRSFPEAGIIDLGRHFISLRIQCAVFFRVKIDFSTFFFYFQ
jgi:hypothetical protein